MSRNLISIVCFVGGLTITTSAVAADPPAKFDRAAFDQAVSKGIDYLRTKGQATDGSYTAPAGPGFTAIATMAVLRNGRGVNDPQVAKGLKYLEGFVQVDGSICAPDSRIKTYETSLALVCFSLANKDGRYKQTIANTEKYLKGSQWDGEEGQSPADVNYGGAGYGGKSRPDLSNTAMLLDALQAAGDDANDEAIKKALVFVSRCQNLETEHNTLPFAAKINDGGFYYSPAADGSSPAGKEEQGALRSYGSMTYAGLKSMIFAGLKADDPRVKAATKWLQSNYTLEENPGLGSAGLFYYYHLMAKSLDALGQPTFEDAKGTKHDWRAELAAELIKRQKPDGSWINDNHKWMEGDPNLTTSFALLSLAYCRPVK